MKTKLTKREVKALRKLLKAPVQVGGANTPSLTCPQHPDRRLSMAAGVWFCSACASAN